RRATPQAHRAAELGGPRHDGSEGTRAQGRNQNQDDGGTHEVLDATVPEIGPVDRPPPGGASFGLMATLRTEISHGGCSIVLTRAREYNTITPALRDELAEAIDRADADPAARVILLRAEGPAFCAGYGLDWSTTAQAGELRSGGPGASGATPGVWDSVADWRFMRRFVDVYMKLWYAQKPTIAAVQGWCIGGGGAPVVWAGPRLGGQ